MKKKLSLALAILMLLSLCACGKQSTSTYYTPSEPGYASASNNAYYAAEESAVTYDYAESAASSSYGLSGSGAAAKTAGTSDADTPDDNPEKIIYSADVTLETTEYDAAIEGVNALLAQFGGYVESSSANNSTYSNIARGNRYNRSTSYTLRIPSAHFTEIMNSFSALGNIPHSYTYTENVTSQYYDVQARLNAYQVQEQTLLELMNKAETVEDIITIQNQLTEVRYTIESLQSTLKNWDRRVSYSTISLSVQEVSVYTPTKTPTFGERVSESFTYGFEAAGDFLESLLLWLLESLPTLIILGVILWGIIAFIRKLHRASVAKRIARGELPKQKRSLFSRKNAAQAPVAGENVQRNDTHEN